jgi:ketosteroid isomerase-like protein
VEEERIEVVRRAMAAVSRRDVAAFIEDVAPDCELHPLMSVWPQPYRGHDGIERWFRDLAEVWDEFTVEPESFRGLGDDTLLVRMRWRGRGRGSEAELDGPSAALWRFRGELVVSARIYPDEARAMQAFEAEG